MIRGSSSYSRGMLRGAMVLPLALAAGCSSMRAAPRWKRHFDRDVWVQGLERHSEQAEQWAPEVAFAGVAGAMIFFDADFSEDSPHHYLTGGNTTSGDLISNAVGFSPLVLAGLKWGQGDEGESFEVAAEALLATAAVTGILKDLTHRRRPQGSNSHDSFPSGHTSFAAAGATILAREIQASTGSDLGYLAFLPMVYVAVDRVEGGRHWASDVAAGAAIGMFLANWIYNAHVPHEHEDDRTIFGRRQPFVWSVEPVVSGDELALGITFAF